MSKPGDGDGGDVETHVQANVQTARGDDGLTPMNRASALKLK